VVVIILRYRYVQERRTTKTAKTSKKAASDEWKAGSFAVFDALGVCHFSSAKMLLFLAAGFACAQARGPEERPVANPSTSFSREMLKEHNAVRAQVKVPPLQWSEDLAAVAQRWANRLLSQRKFEHSPDTRYGENLFDISGQAATPAWAVRFWASESRNYDYASNTCRGLCGHYTQIVWRDTKSAGCAVARGGGREVWVCNYDPPGNWLGQRPY
jgi:pathogenesis-related protein 1